MRKLFKGKNSAMRAMNRIVRKHTADWMVGDSGDTFQWTSGDAKTIWIHVGKEKNVWVITSNVSPD